MTREELARDSYRCWELAIACLREQGVRRGDYVPVNEKERLWAAEGRVGPSSLASMQSDEAAS